MPVVAVYDSAGAAAMVAHFLDSDAPNPAPERDGMAWLSLYLPADTALAIWNRTTALARGLQSSDEPRSMTQILPDIAAHLLLSAGPALIHSPKTTTRHNNTGEGSRGEGNTVTTEDGHHNAIGRASLATVDFNDTTTAANGSAEHEGAGGNGYANLANVPAPEVDVLVTVPVLSLLGLTDESAMLDGYGPIPASMARKLVADGASSFYGVLVDPRTAHHWKSAAVTTGCQSHEKGASAQG